MLKKPGLKKRRSLRGFHQVVDGVSYYVKRPFDFEQCCDCNLVHKVKYEVVDQEGNAVVGMRIRLTVWRDERSTAASRRPFKFIKDEEDE